MGLYLNPGNDAFKRALRSEIYVDKSGMIAYTNRVLDSEQGYICVSRPRRFGKSMAANMLCAYYSKACDSKRLFHDLKAATLPQFQEHLNRHDVLMLNIQQFMRGAENGKELVRQIESRVLSELRADYPCAVRETETSLPNALAAIYTADSGEDKGFIFIVDEWDCVFRENRMAQSDQREYLDFLRDLFKDRTYVKLVYMTGILPIKKYGTHSALNIFDEFSMTDPRRMAEYVGFTEREVRELCSSYGMDFGEAKRWYDGYLFDQELHIYNPKSIVDAMHNGKLKNYWTRTETYEALKFYIDLNFDGLKDAVTAMLGGVRCKINPEKFQNDMTSFYDKSDVLTLLVHLGYLAYDDTRKEVYIPNLEIEEEFRNAVEGSKGWEHLNAAIESSETILQATWDQNAEIVADGIAQVHTDNTSILSYNDENSLSCVVTLAYYSAKREYTLVRELPTGKGFADIAFLPRRGSDKPAMLVELKWNQSAKGAIAQMKERQYVKALEEYSGDLLLVGINYDKKTKTHSCVIEKQKL